ncbi:hypothetical protein BJ170DRAFT_643819 [Xylariales sp. AK1849]|nr:hypothetical protein BJ170DRAFT_643819 [Xylariales sp. AK1849]
MSRTRGQRQQQQQQQQRQQQHREERLIDFDDSPPASFSDISTPGTSTPETHQPSPSSYGLSAAISGLWSRWGATSPTPTPTPTPSHSETSSSSRMHNSATFPSSHPSSSFGGRSGNGVYTPPRRTASPRGLPSLEPLVLKGYHADTDVEERLLSRSIAEEIRTFLPERLKIGDEWKLVYSLHQNGSSLGTLYKLCDEYRGRRVGFVLVVRDGLGGTFGAYLTEAPHIASSYYGTGECFLWRASIHVPLPPPPSADTTDLQSTRSTTIADSSHPHQEHLVPGLMDPTTNKLNETVSSKAAHAQHSLRFQNFAYTGANDYCISSETKFLGVGGGLSGDGARYGLWLDDAFSYGHSAPCDTFCNGELSDEGKKFEVLGVELWVVGAG